ncbi:hypothetical protein C0J52_03924 [Blattella germanica]|nr:hypothetical protein C0J52_03924 [Blattella germanica]
MMTKSTHHHETDQDLENHPALMSHSLAFHGGYKETILFYFWKIDSVGGIIGSMIGVFLMAALYEGLNRVLFFIVTQGLSILEDVQRATVPGGSSTTRKERRRAAKETFKVKFTSRHPDGSVHSPDDNQLLPNAHLHDIQRVALRRHHTRLWVRLLRLQLEEVHLGRRDGAVSLIDSPVLSTCNTVGGVHQTLKYKFKNFPLSVLIGAPLKCLTTLWKRVLLSDQSFLCVYE